MAYDTYRGSSPSFEPLTAHSSQEEFAEPSVSHPLTTPPYPSQYVPDRVQMPQPPSLAGPPLPSRPPNINTQVGLNDAVASAVRADNSGYLSPDVISHITANVIQQLKTLGLDNLPGQQPPPSPGLQPNSYDESSSSDHGRNVHTPPSADGHELDSSPPQSKHLKPSVSAVAPDRNASPLSQNNDQAWKEIRPTLPSRVPTLEVTTLEKIWGRLFDNGKPTPRLGQFLRGIAVHLIEDYAPGNTIVIVPDKMQKFYEDTKVPSDNFPWQDVFDDRTSEISRLYREIEVEHHLVQDNLNEKPDIPGLTPRGFERWATLLIQAYPDREFSRLQKAVLDMPISNPDDKKERFPKELPRRLFPISPDLTLRQRLQEFIRKHCDVDPPPVPVEETQSNPHRRNPPVERATGNMAAESKGSSMGEREHQPHSTPSSMLVDDVRPIERERKPYRAQPGGGKVYEDEPRHKYSDSLPINSKSRDFLLAPGSSSNHGLSRSYGQDSYIRPAGSGAGSGALGTVPTSTSNRARSSSLGVGNPGDYRRSESDLPHSPNAGYLGQSSSRRYHSPAGSALSAADLIDDSQRFRDYDRDDGRGYDSLRDHGRDRDRERGKYPDEDYYHSGLLGGQGGSASSGNGGYFDDYKSGYGR
ncbi:hypothetical protein V8E54_010652 [Elaphomyces granulatus]